MKIDKNLKLVAAVVVLVLVAATIGIAVGLLLGDSEPAAPSSPSHAQVVGAPVSIELPPGKDAVVAHESGARIVVPEGATRERTTVSIAELEPPVSPLGVRRAFDFSVGGAELEDPVTIHIPFELEPGQDASSVHALHWDEETVGWEPVPGVVDEASGTIVVTTDRLSIFSWLWVKVEASCVTDRAVVGVGETLTVVSAVTSSMIVPVDVYMTPSVNRVGDAVGGGSLGRTEVATVGLGKRAELAYEVVPTAPGGYRVQCRIFWVTNRASTRLVSKELESEDPTSAVVTVKGDGAPTAGAHLRIEEIVDEYPTIYTGQSYSILVDVGNAGDERSGRFDLVADFTSAADGQTTRLHHSLFEPDNPRYGREEEVDPGNVDKRRISVEVPDGLVPGEYRVCVGIAHTDGSEADPDAGACLDRYVLSSSEGAMVVTVSPVDTLGGRRAWAALPEKVSIEVLRKAIEFGEMKDDETLKTVYKRVAGELAFRKAVAPGPERRHTLQHGLKEKVDDPLEIGGYITDVCLDSGIDCGKALDRFGLTVQDSGILTKFPTVPNEAVSFFGQSVSGTLLFYDVYYTMLVNQALDLDQALDTLDGLEKLPLGDLWKEAVAEARNEVAVTASPDKWTAYAAGIVQNRGDILQFAGVQAVKGLVHAAAKRQLLHHAGIAGQKALVPALGLKPVGGTVTGAGGLAAAGPAAFVASVWFASEVYRSVEAQEEQLGMAALAAFINAAFSDPEFIEREFIDPAERANVQEAMAYAKYMAYDNLHKAEDGWMNSLWAHLKLYAADRRQFLEEMEAGRAEALEELMYLLSPESVEVDPETLALAAGESGKLRARATARSGRAAGHPGFVWTSDAPGTATVSQDGVVTGVAPGEAVIAVRTGGAEASAKVAVAVATHAGASLHDPPSVAGNDESGGSSAFVSISAGPLHTCGVKSDSSVSCWGNNTFGQSTPPVGKFASVHAGWHHTCGVKTDGSVVCWGSGVEFAPPPDGEFSSLSAVDLHTCGVRTDGSVACWGHLHDFPTPPDGEFVSVSTGWLHVCGLRTDASVACWGVGDEELTPPDGEFASVSVGLNQDYPHACGVRIDGSIACWGDTSPSWATPPDGEFISISAGPVHTCGVRTDGSVACWGLGSLDHPPPDGEFVSVDAGKEHTCGLRRGGEVVCWGIDDYGRATPPISKYTSVSVGGLDLGSGNVCAIRSDGSVACWGPITRHPSFTLPSGEFVSVSTASSHACGVRTDGSVACWGDDDEGGTTPPEGTFVSVSSATSTIRSPTTFGRQGNTCGVRANGSVACWGYDGGGQSSPPDGEFVSVSAGGHHTCGVRTNGSVACWGENDYGESTPPPGEFASVNAGIHQTCGVRTDESVVCWGEVYGESWSPDGEFESVSVGAGLNSPGHACGVRIDGSVACWAEFGFDSDRYTPAAEELVSLSVGAAQTCGVRTDGSIVCWGREGMIVLSELGNSVTQNEPSISVMSISTPKPVSNVASRPPSPIFTPSWSPDGARIAFHSSQEWGFEIYVMNADGSDVTRLTDNKAPDVEPSWSPDGRRIVFKSSSDSVLVGWLTIYAMDADGSNVTQLTDRLGWEDVPSWSPDGRHIAFASYVRGNHELYILDIDRADVTRLTANRADDKNPSWSPDGQHIAFTSDREGDFGIYVMDVDGSDVTRLTVNRSDEMNPSWSPDGQRIMFSTDRGEIFVMDADGSNVTRLADELGWEAVPSWSPDGRRIAFESGREIYVMNADGSEVTRLTDSEAWDGGPTWSSDGRRIAFTSARDGDVEIYVMNSDGSGMIHLTDH